MIVLLHMAALRGYQIDRVFRLLLALIWVTGGMHSPMGPMRLFSSSVNHGDSPTVTQHTCGEDERHIPLHALPGDATSSFSNQRLGLQPASSAPVRLWIIDHLPSVVSIDPARVSVFAFPGLRAPPAL